jgi:hypothetical protein
LRNELSRYGFSNFQAIPGVVDSTKRIGVARAFLQALESHTDDVPLLILEDDAVVWHDYHKVEIPNDADALYLGICRHGMESVLNSYYTNQIVSEPVAERVDDQIYRIYNMLNAHAIIIINSEYKNFLIRAIKTAIRIGTNQDRARAETMKYWNVYALNKPMFYQDDAAEDHRVTQTKIIVDDLVSSGEILTDLSCL